MDYGPSHYRTWYNGIKSVSHSLNDMKTSVPLGNFINSLVITLTPITKILIKIVVHFLPIWSPFPLVKLRLGSTFPFLVLFVFIVVLCIHHYLNHFMKQNYH